MSGDEDMNETVNAETVAQGAGAIANSGNIGANLAILIVVMLLAGLLGGLVNYFLRVPEKAHVSNESWLRRFRANRLLHQCLLMGVAAALVVPVFLQIAALGVDNNIVTNFLTKAGGAGSAQDLASAYSSLALVGGFCVLAAISSPTFLQNLSAKILQQVAEVKSAADEASSQARQARGEAETAQERTELLEKAREPEIDARLEALRQELMQKIEGAPVSQEDPDEEDAAAQEPTGEELAAERQARTAQEQTDEKHGFQLSELDRLILQALAAKPNTRRSVKGIRTDPALTSSTNHAKETYRSVRNRLYRMESAGYVRALEGSDGGLPRWKLGTRGWAELK